MNQGKPTTESVRGRAAAMAEKAGRAAWLAVGVIVGFAAGAVVVLLAIVLPGQRTAAQQQEALRQWAELNRVEQQRVGDLKQVSAAELQKWVAMVSEQNARFNEIQQRLHEQELELADPGVAVIVIVALVALGSMGFLAFMYRDVNKEAAVTLQNLAALPPESVVSVVRTWSANGEKGGPVLPRSPVTRSLRAQPGD